MELFTAFTRRFGVRCLAVFALLFLAENTVLLAQSSNALKHTFLAPLTGAQSGAELGFSAAADANFIVLGAPQDDTGGNSRGVVKVFHATTGALMYVLPNPNPAEGYDYGEAVALSGGRLVVGAPDDDKAYVYNLAGATPTVPVLTLTTPNSPAAGSFGNAVSISGLRVVVGDEDDDTGASNAGSVFVYHLASATPTVPVAVLNNPAPAVDDRFGDSVAVSGSRVIVGARWDDGVGGSQGSAFLYDLAGATPTVPLGSFTNPAPGTSDLFGSSVALNGTIAVVGAPEDYAAGIQWSGSAYVYDVGSGTPFTAVQTLNNPTPELGDRFGTAVAVSGNLVVVSAPYADDGANFFGITYAYDITSGTPTVPIAILPNPTPADYDNFGLAVAIAGTRVVVGAPEDDTAASNAGSGYIFDLSGGTPTMPVLTLNHSGPSANDEFGRSVSVSGTRTVVGSPFDDTGGDDAGIATVHDLASGTPSTPILTLTNPTPSARNFGHATAISGNLVVVGAPSSGKAYVYDLGGATPTLPAFTLTNPSGGGGDFGRSVAISGTRVAVGMPRSPSGGFWGRVCIYDLAGATPLAPVLILSNAVESFSNSGFGFSVSLSGTMLAVGAPLNNLAGAAAAGQVFVYDIASGTPSVATHVLQKSAPVAYDQFGYSVAISGNRVAVGVYGDDTAFSDGGAVHVFDLSGAMPTAPALVIPDSGSADNVYAFGGAVALSGARLVVGGVAATLTEHVVVFNLDRAAPGVPVAVFKSPEGNNSDFGESVAIDGTTIAVGAPGYDAVLGDKGAAFIYGPSTTLTQTPTLNSPASGAVFTTSVSVNFTLPEAALPGTVKLSFLKNATPTIFTLAATEETAGTHSFTFSPANPTATAAIASGAPLPDGAYTVALSYQDAIGSYAATSNAATTVRVDNTAPVVAPPPGGFTPLVFATPAVAPSYTAQAVVTDLGGTASITQSPAPGAALAAGSNLITITATDFVGLSGSTSFNVTVLTFTQDTDGDGLNDAAEFQMATLGFDWQTAQTALVNTLFNNANGAGLYTTPQIQTLNVDVPLLTRDAGTGLFKLTLGLKKSTSLPTFTTFPMTAPQTLINADGKLEFYFTSPDNAAFFRVEAK